MYNIIVEEVLVYLTPAIPKQEGEWAQCVQWIVKMVLKSEMCSSVYTDRWEILWPETPIVDNVGTV